MYNKAKIKSKQKKYRLLAYVVGMENKFYASNLSCIIPCPDSHAEFRLARKVNLRGKHIRICRFNASGKYTMAKPCANCQRILRHAGVRKVEYTDNEGKWQCL